MTRGDRHGPFLRRLSGAVLALVALALLLALPSPQPAAAAPETQWVLTQTLVNPDKEKLEYRGGGSDPEFFGEERFKGMVVIYKPSATSFSVKDRWQDREYIAWDVTITCNFSAPEKTLVPGRLYKLTAKFSHTGSTIEPHPGETFSYSGSDSSLDPNEPLSYYPSNPGPPSKTWSLTAPAGAPGATMEIYAGLWNSPGCTVVWKYEARAVAPEYGVIEIDGVIHLVSPPGGVLQISRADLPEWARDAVATVGDTVLCVGPPTALTTGDYTVLLDGMPVARVGDRTGHGGHVVEGNPRILVNGVPAATVGDHQVCPMVTGVVPHVGGPVVGRPGTLAPRTPTSGQTITVQPQPRTVTEGEFEKMKTNVAAQATSALGPVIGELMKQGYIGMVIAATGDCALYDHTGERMRDPAGRRIYSETGSYQLVRIGDTLQTGSNGLMRIELFDWDGDPRHRPSVVNMATNTTSVFDWFGQHPSSSTVISLLRGAVRTISGVWKDPNLTIKAAVTLCYVKGSDVLVSYDPENYVLASPDQEGPVEYLGASVLEGHMEVTDSSTGKTVSLTDGQMAMSIDGAMDPAGSFSEEQWDGWVESLGLENIQPLSTAEWEALIYGETPTTTPPTTAGTTTTSPPPAGPSATGGQEPATSTQEEFEQMLADVAAFADSGVRRGLLNETDLLKQGYIGLLGTASGELSVYDHAGQAVDLSVPRIEAEERAYLVPIRVGDTVSTGIGQGIVYLFTRYSSERLVLEVDSNTEVVFRSVGTGTSDVSPTLLRIVRGMIRFHYTAKSSSDVFSLEVGAQLLRAGQGSDAVISYDPDEGIEGVWAREGNMDVTSSRTGESEFLGDGWGLVMEEGKDGAYSPLTDDLWDDITLGSTLDDVKPCKVLTVEQSARPGGRPLALVEFEESNLSLVLAVVIPVVAVLAAASGVTIYLLRRRRRATGGALRPAGGEPAASASVAESTELPAFSPAFCRHCGSPRRPGIVFCESCGKKLDA